jgi:hypothetical protein
MKEVAAKDERIPRNLRKTLLSADDRAVTGLLRKTTWVIQARAPQNHAHANPVVAAIAKTCSSPYPAPVRFERSASSGFGRCACRIRRQARGDIRGAFPA